MDVKKMAGNDQLEIYARQEFGKNGKVAAVMHGRRVLDDRARLVAAFVEHWGMVAGQPDGEDSTGRSKLKLSSEADVVARAIKMVEIMWPAFSERGWMIDQPPFEEFIAAVGKPFE